VGGIELKAMTRLTASPGRIPQPPSPHSNLKCDVDGCLVTEVLSCEVRVTEPHILPGGETHIVHLCQTHQKNVDALKWEWGRNPDAGGHPHAKMLQLSGVYALDSDEVR